MKTNISKMFVESKLTVGTFSTTCLVFFRPLSAVWTVVCVLQLVSVCVELCVTAVSSD